MAVRVAAPHDHPAARVVRFGVLAGLARAAAPGAGKDLDRVGGPGAGVLGPHVVEGLFCLVVPVGRHLRADPQADTERLGTPWVACTTLFRGGQVSVATELLGGAHEGRSALELLGSEQAQRVAHDHRDASPAVAATDVALQPAHSEHVGDEPEVGLRLAAAGREEEQVGEPLVVRCWATLGVGGHGQGREV